MAFGEIFLAGHGRQSRAGKIAPSCPLGQPITAQDLIHLACSRSQRYNKNIYSGDVVSKDVLNSFRNLLQSGDGTSAKKLDEDLDILCASKSGNVGLSKWSKDDFSTGLIPDDIDRKYFTGKPVVTKTFGLCFAAKEKFY